MKFFRKCRSLEKQSNAIAASLHLMESLSQAIFLFLHIGASFSVIFIVCRVFFYFFFLLSLGTGLEGVEIWRVKQAGYRACCLGW